MSKKVKQNLLKYILAGFFLALSAAFLIVILNLQIPKQNGDWKTYQNNEYKFSFRYPPSIFISTKTDTNLTLYLNEKETEILRINIYKENKNKDSEFKIKTVNISNNLFDVILFPAGLDSGDFKLTQPILYYVLYRDGLKYSFQFNNRLTLTSLQKEIISTFSTKQ